MKKLVAVSIFLLAFLMNAHAVSDFKTTLASIPPAGALKATFVQKRYAAETSTPLISQGEMILWNGKGLLWNLKDPFATIILISRSGIFKIDEGIKSSLLDGQSEGAAKVIFTLISHILNGSLSQLKDFTPQYLPSPAPGKWKLSFIPAKSLQPFIASILIEGGTVIQQITILRPNGDRDEITFANHTVFDSSALDRVISPVTRALFND